MSSDFADPAGELLLNAARQRLRAALDGLDQALSRHKQLVLEQSDQIAEFSLLQEDRSRLAQELDAATSRVRLLEAANLEAGRRIERASAAVRAVIAADLGADPEVTPQMTPQMTPQVTPQVTPEVDSDLEPGANPARED